MPSAIATAPVARGNHGERRRKAHGSKVGKCNQPWSLRVGAVDSLIKTRLFLVSIDLFSVFTSIFSKAHRLRYLSERERIVFFTHQAKAKPVDSEVNFYLLHEKANGRSFNLCVHQPDKQARYMFTEKIITTSLDSNERV